MPLPKMIGGSEDEGRKPGMLVTISATKRPSGMPKMIGGEGQDEPDGDEGGLDNEQVMDDSIDMLVSEMKRMNPSRDRLKKALKAFFYACDAEPHREGEHTDEEERE